MKSAHRNHEVVPHTTRKVADAVDTAVVTLKTEVRSGRVETPHLDGAIKRGADESVRILRVELDLHHVVTVTLECLQTIPTWRKTLIQICTWMQRIIEVWENTARSELPAKEHAHE